MTQPRKIRVRIPAVTVEVDADAWNLEYGSGTDTASVRDDVKSYFDLANNMPDHLTGIVAVSSGPRGK